MQYEDSSEDELSTDGGSDVDDKDEQNGLVDVEDLGNIMNKQKTANVSLCMMFHKCSDRESHCCVSGVTVAEYISTSSCLPLTHPFQKLLF